MAYEARLFGIEGLEARGWRVPDGIPFGEWRSGMDRVQLMESLGAWAVADGIIAGLERYGDDAWQGIDLHHGEKTINRMVATARDFPIERRRPGVSLWKAEIMRPLPRAEQDRLMKDASEEGFTVETIRELVDAYEGKDRAEVIDTKRCPQCGALADYWERVPGEASASEEGWGIRNLTREGR